MIKKTIIERFRKEKGLTQVFMASKVGLSERQYRRIEKGEVKKFDLKVISIVSKELNISVDDIVKDYI